MGAAVGFRVKSGWAAAVLIAGGPDSPQVRDCRAIQLSDPAIPESRQPYHAAMGMLEKNAAKIERRKQIIKQAAAKSVSELLGGYAKEGYRVSAAALVVGSRIDPEAIKNDHIRAHALEGRLFRVTLEEALRLSGLETQTIVEREVYPRAVSVLARDAGELKKNITAMGRSLTGSWRADEKMAALAAWTLLR